MVEICVVVPGGVIGGGACGCVIIIILKCQGVSYVTTMCTKHITLHEAIRKRVSYSSGLATFRNRSCVTGRRSLSSATRRIVILPVATCTI